MNEFDDVSWQMQWVDDASETKFNFEFQGDSESGFDLVPIDHNEIEKKKQALSWLTREEPR